MAKKVLVIDDDNVVVDFLVNILKDAGYDTCVATDGRQALEIMKQEKPDLVTLDLEMPEEWGPRFFRKYQQDDELKGTPVLVISGMPSRHLSLKGAIGYLAKPFDPAKVVELIRDAIGQ